LFRLGNVLKHLKRIAVHACNPSNGDEGKEDQKFKTLCLKKKKKITWQHLSIKFEKANLFLRSQFLHSNKGLELKLTGCALALGSLSHIYHHNLIFTIGLAHPLPVPYPLAHGQLFVSELNLL
jgi:hypothetical protein